jgi:hypothetical protein
MKVNIKGLFPNLNKDLNLNKCKKKETFQLKISVTNLSFSAC